MFGMSVCYVQVADHNQFNTFATLPLDEVSFCLNYHFGVVAVNDESLGLLMKKNISVILLMKQTKNSCFYAAFRQLLLLCTVLSMNCYF